MYTKFEAPRTVIYHGDAMEVLDAEIADSSVDLIFADPPYNIGKDFSGFLDKWPSESEYANWCHRWLTACIRKLKSSGTLYVMASTQSMPHIDLFLREHLSVMSRIVWHYDSSGVQAKSYFGSLYEPILFCVKDENNYKFNGDQIRVEAKTGATRKLIDYRGAMPKRYSTTKIPGNVWYFPRVRFRMPEYEDHPSQKPESLLERIVSASSDPGDVVLDPFSGTFTTSAVANRMGRVNIGIERAEEYVKIGLRRLKIQSHLDGEPLLPPNKRYIRKNGKQAAGRVSSGQRDLF
jgi:site-specific DNA-methyltransferase (adenine-specific)